MLMAATGVYAASDERITDADAFNKCLQQEGEATCKVLILDKLTADVTVKGKINLVLDLGADKVLKTDGKKIVVAEGASLTIDGGVIDAEEKAAKIVEVNAGGTLEVKNTTLKTSKPGETTKNMKGLIVVYAATKESTPTAKVTLGADSKLVGQSGIMVQPGADANGYKNEDAAGYNVELNLNGNITAQEYAVQVNGNVDPSKNIVVNVKAGNYISEKAIALYAAGVSTWNIEDGVKVTGAEAVIAKGGTVNINGGTFTADKSTSDPLNTRASESAKGAAVAVLYDENYNEDGNGTNNTLALNVVNGTFTSKTGYALYIEDATTDDDKTIKPSVKGGSFVSKDENKDAVKAEKLSDDNELFIEGGSFTVASTGSKLYEYLIADLALGTDEKGNAIVGTPHYLTLKVNKADGVSVSYKIPAKPWEYVKGQYVNLIELLGLDEEDGPKDTTKRYAVRYTASNGTTGLDKFTMVDDDVTIEAEIVEVSAKTKPSEDIPTTPTPGTDSGTVTPGTQEPGTTDPGTTDEDLDNPNTLDNVTSVAAMGGISLAIAAAGIATLKKREN